jgi:hypothetical protein
MCGRQRTYACDFSDVRQIKGLVAISDRKSEAIANIDPQYFEKKIGAGTTGKGEET